MSNSDSSKKIVRFQQRRSNLIQSWEFLNEALQSTSEERIKSAAVIKAFEMTFELSWKTLKDLLEYNGIMTNSPRDVIKEAFKASLIKDGQSWIDLLDQRNMLVHIYNENQAKQAHKIIQSVGLPLLQQLIDRLNQE